MINKQSTTKTVIVTKDIHLVEPLSVQFPHAIVLQSPEIDELIEWFFVPKF